VDLAILARRRLAEARRVTLAEVRALLERALLRLGEEST
jgi:hypothetical protein